MALSNLFSVFIPKDKKFFKLFSQASETLVEVATAFSELVNTNDPVKRKEIVKRISDLEHKADDVTHNIFTELSSNFITPFDREDIHYLASSLDDIVDYIHGSANRIELYKIGESTLPMRKMAEVIQQSTSEIHIAVSSLNNLGNAMRIREAIVRINSLENHADTIFDTAIAELFENEKNAIELMKMKELLANMETATDKCEDVANVIETILVKNS